MTYDAFGDAYVPDRIPDEDLSYFEKGGHGTRIGWGESPAVLVVDMTEEFTSSDYSAGRSDTGERAVSANERLLEAAREANLPVAYTRPWDGMPATYRGTTKSVRDESAAEERAEANVVREELAPEEGDIEIEKPRASAFFDTHLDNMLHYYGVDTLIVTGMTTSGCVRASVVDSHSSNFRTIVPIEAVADRSVISHEINLFDIDMKYADVTPLDEVVERIRELS